MSRHLPIYLLFGSIVLSAATATAQGVPQPKPRFGAEVNKVFFNDAFEHYTPGGLPGDDVPERKTPEPSTNPPQIAGTTPTPEPDPISSPVQPSNPFGPGNSSAPLPGMKLGTGKWTSIIPTNVLENEVKRQVAATRIATRSIGLFKQRGHRQAHRQFSLLAVLFGVVKEYDGEVRWQDEAAAIRDLSAQAAAECEKEPSRATFEAAEEHSIRLGDLMNATKLSLPSNPPEKVSWSELASLPPLMQRMEEGLQTKLNVWGANEAEFQANQEDFLHEASILAMLGKVIQDKGYLDEPDYQKFAKMMEENATKAVQGASQGQFQMASQALVGLTQSCTQCHSQYR